MKHLFLAYLFVIFFVSCKSKTENNAPVVLPTASTISPGSNDTSATLNNTAGNNTAGLTLNPEHGKPGHRCDLAVGAPLNAPPTTSIAPSTVASAPTIVPAATSKAEPKAEVASGALNPKHGDPGHRCDIAVGAPLNSKPTQ